MAGSAVRPGACVASPGVFKMSPSRCTEMRTCWKSCQSWARRSTGEATRPASMLNATSSPTVRLSAMTSRAPIELLLEPPTQDGCDHEGERDVEWDRAEDDPRERGAVVVHDGQEHDREHDVDHQHDGRPGQEAADVLLLAHPRHGVADAPRLEIGER